MSPKKRRAGEAGDREKHARSPTQTRITPEERWNMIAEAAYYLAEKRGFSDAHAEQDWQEAEARIDARIAEHEALIKWSYLQEQEARIRAIVNTTPDAVITTDQQGIITSFNPAAERMFGYAAKEAIGQNVSLLMPSPYREEHDGYISRYLETGRSRTIGNTREFLARRKDGSVFPIEVSLTEFREGTQVFFAGILRDISQRKQAEEALRESGERYRTVVQTAGSAILVVSLNGEILEWNDAAERLYGYKREEVLGKDYLAHFVHGAFRELVASDIKEVLAGKTIRGFENQVVTRDGATRWVTWNVSRMLNARGQATGIIAVGQDVTDRKESEQRYREHQTELAHAARLSTLGEMATTLAHELNQPLSAIVSYSEGAARRFRAKGAGSEPLLHALNETARLARRSAGIVRGIRQFVRKRKFTPAYLDLNDVVRESMRLIEGEARSKGIAQTVELALALPAVEGDFIQIEQVVLNLLRNGIDALEGVQDGDRVLIVRTSTRAPHEVELTVSDTGSGLSPDSVPRLFDPLFTTKPEGLGIGLSISRTIVEAHGGRIWADSDTGTGATFHVALPARDSEQGSAAY